MFFLQILRLSDIMEFVSDALKIRMGRQMLNLR